MNEEDQRRNDNVSVAEISQIVEKAAKIIHYGLLNPPNISINSEYQTLYLEFDSN